MIGVLDIGRHLLIGDACPQCGSGIGVAVAKSVRGGVRVYRLECLACAWVTDALPDPKAVN